MGKISNLMKLQTCYITKVPRRYFRGITIKINVRKMVIFYFIQSLLEPLLC